MISQAKLKPKRRRKITTPIDIVGYARTQMWLRPDLGVFTGGGRGLLAADKAYFSIADNAALSMGDIDFSIVGWFNVSNVTNAQGIIGKWYGGSNKEYLVYVQSGKVRFVVSHNGSTNAEIASTETIVANTWYFVVAWHDSVNDTLNISINNGTPASLAHTLGVCDSTSAFEIGRSSGSLYFDGSISKFMITKRVLTSDERTFLYNLGNGRSYAECGVAGTAGANLITGLVSYWNCNESDQTAGLTDQHSTNDLARSASELLQNQDFSIRTGVTGVLCTATDKAHLEANDSAAFNLSTTDFVINANVLRSSIGTDQVICEKYQDSSNYWQLRITASNYVRFTSLVAGAWAIDITAITTALSSTSTKYHIQVVIDRSNAGNCKIYVNGISQTFGLSASARELLTNGGFETAGGGGADVFGTWSENQPAGSTISRTTTAGEFNSGTAACKLVNTTAGCSLYVGVNVAPSTKHRLSFMTRGDGTNQGRYYVYDVTNGAVISGIVTTGVTSTTYTAVNYDFTTPAGCTNVEIAVISSSSAGSTVYFDDVSLKQYIVLDAANLDNTGKFYVGQTGAGTYYQDGRLAMIGIAKMADASAAAVTTAITNIAGTGGLGQYYGEQSTNDKTALGWTVFYDCTEASGTRSNRVNPGTNDIIEAFGEMLSNTDFGSSRTGITGANFLAADKAHLETADSATLDLGVSDFILNANVLRTSVGTMQVICGKYQDENNRWLLRISAGNYLEFMAVVAGNVVLHILASTTAMASTSTKYHVQLVVDRSNAGNCKMFVNGVSQDFSLSAYAPEMLSNTGFETAGAGGADVFANWSETAAGGGIITDETTVVHGGGHAVKVDRTVGSSAYLTQGTMVLNAKYTATAWARSVSGSATLQMGEYVYQQTIGVDGTYTQKTVTFTPTVNTAFLIGAASGHAGYFDDVSLKQHIVLDASTNLDNTGKFYVGQKGEGTLYHDGRICMVGIAKPSDASTADVTTGLGILAGTSGLGAYYGEYTTAASATVESAVNMVAFWDMTEASGNRTDKIGSIVLSEAFGEIGSNTTFETRTGITGASFAAGDKSWLEANDSATLDLGTGDFILNINCLRTSVGTSQTIVRKYQDTNNNWYVYFNSSNYVCFVATVAGNVIIDMISSTTACSSTSTKYHIQVVVDRSNIANCKILVNGVSQAFSLSSYSVELVTNTGFETLGAGGADVFANWIESTMGTSSINDETSVVQSGSHACRYDHDSSGSAAYVRQTVLVSGAMYTASVYAKCSSGSPVLAVGSSGGGGGTPQNLYTLTTNYTQYTGAFTATNNEFWIIRSSGANSLSIYVDSVSCKPNIFIKDTTTSLDNTGKLIVGSSGGSIFYDGRIAMVGIAKPADASAADVTTGLGYLAGTSGLGAYYGEYTAAASAAVESAVNMVAFWDMTEASGNRTDKVGGLVLSEALNELVTNGTFASDISGWTSINGSGTIAWDAGTIKISQGSSTSQYLKAYQAVSTVSGRSYAYSFYHVANNFNDLYYRCGISSTIPTSASTQFTPELALHASNADATTYSGTVTATGTSSYVVLMNYDGASYYGSWDNISFKAANIPCHSDADLFGSFTETILGAGYGYIDIDTNVYNDGVMSCRLRSTVATTMGGVYQQPGTAGRNYTVTCSAKISDDSDATELAIYVGAGSFAERSLTTSFATYANGSTNASNGTMAIYLTDHANGKTVWIDTYSVKANSIPSLSDADLFGSWTEGQDVASSIEIETDNVRSSPLALRFNTKSTSTYAIIVQNVLTIGHAYTLTAYAKGSSDILKFRIGSTISDVTGIVPGSWTQLSFSGVCTVNNQCTIAEYASNQITYVDDVSCKCTSIPCSSDADLFGSWNETGGVYIETTDIDSGASPLACRIAPTGDNYVTQGSIVTVGNLYTASVRCKSSSASYMYILLGNGSVNNFTTTTSYATYSVTAAAVGNGTFYLNATVVGKTFLFDTVSCKSAAIAVTNGPAEAMAWDSSGNGYHGKFVGVTPSGMITNWRNDVPAVLAAEDSRAFSFDGVDDYLDIPAATNPSLPLSVCVWIKRRTNDADWEGIFRWCSLDSPYGGIDVFSHSNGKLGAFVNNDYRNNITTTNVYPNNEWHLVGLVASGSSFAIYIDGVKASADGAIVGYTPASYTIRIGKNYANGECFDGLMDDVRVYNRALTASDWTQLLAGTNVTSGLIRHYKLDDGAFGVPSDLDPVHSWESQEGNRRLFSQGDATKRPILHLNEVNGKPALYFDGTDDLLTMASQALSGSQGSVLIVAKMTDSVSRTILSESDTATASKYMMLGTNSSNKVQIDQINADTIDTVKGGTSVNTNTHAFWFESDGSQYTITLDYSDETKTVASGADNGNWWDSSTGLDNTVIGALTTTSTSRFFQGYIFDIFVTNTKLTTPQKYKLWHKYVKPRYGI